MIWDLPNPFTLQFRPEAGDIDGLNHTNNAVYVQWCGKIGWSHSEALGIHLADYQRPDRGMAIHRANYHYLQPTAAGDDLTLGTWLLPGDGKLTMERRFQLVRNRGQVTVLRGHWKLVCIELSSGKPRRMPAEFSQIYVGGTAGELGRAS